MSEQKIFHLTDATPPLSNAERERLLKVARLREKVAKAAATERSAKLLADFEQQLASIYSFDTNEVWSKAVAVAKAAETQAGDAIDAECEQLGIPEKFRPGLAINWYGRGENASRERRVELRRVAQTRIQAIEKTARHEIERTYSEAQIELLAHGMSEYARQLLDKMPRVDEMMPALNVQEIEQSTGPRRNY